MGVDYTNIQGTGTLGRIVQADIIAAAANNLPQHLLPLQLHQYLIPEQLL